MTNATQQKMLNMSEKKKKIKTQLFEIMHAW